MLIRRLLSKSVAEAATEFPVIAIMGPRQSGKTTLAQMNFPHHRYLSLEDHDVLIRATSDPRLFLTEQPTEAGLIIDEIHHAPQLLSYMQTIVDRERKNGFFIITGSQNFLVDDAITQTLAGRMAVVTLLPLSIRELAEANLLPPKINTLLYKGSYPKVHATTSSIERLYSNYIRLYVERDVRQIQHVVDLSTFQKFMRLCAGRIGQILNLTSLGNDCGITQKTVKEWLSLLEASYVIFTLAPYSVNSSKRLIKAPKIYFYDTGIACSLLKIRSAEELADHYLRGGLVESLIISDLLKQQYNLERQPSLYFWRDYSGREIDCIIDEGRYQIPIEIKASTTVSTDFFKELRFWQEHVDTPSDTPRYVIYGGTEDQQWPDARVITWQSAGNLIK
jgi:predicted AAA+ superfamily ATPase